MKDWIKKIENILVLDQKLRKNIPDIIKKYGMNSQEFKKITKMISIQDSKNIKVIEEFILKHEWQPIDIIGQKAFTAIFLTIQHAELCIQKKYYPQIKKLYKTKNISPERFALITDRIRIGEGKKQLYGTQIKTTISGYELFSVYDIKNIHTRRSKIGLQQPINDYLKTWNISI